MAFPTTIETALKKYNKKQYLITKLLVREDSAITRLKQISKDQQENLFQLVKCFEPTYEQYDTLNLPPTVNNVYNSILAEVNSSDTTNLKIIFRYLNKNLLLSLDSFNILSNSSELQLIERGISYLLKYKALSQYHFNIIANKQNIRSIIEIFERLEKQSLLSKKKY